MRLMGEAAERAYEAFYEANLGPLVALGWTLTGDREVAGDLAQYALIEAGRRWDVVAGLERPDLWVRRIVVNRSATRFRSLARERRAVARLGRPIQADPTPLSDSTLDFLAAVRRLPRRQAQVVVLHYLEDRSVESTAELLGISAGTVKTSLHRARLALADTLPGRAAPQHRPLAASLEPRS